MYKLPQQKRSFISYHPPPYKSYNAEVQKKSLLMILGTTKMYFLKCFNHLLQSANGTLLSDTIYMMGFIVISQKKKRA